MKKEYKDFFEYNNLKEEGRVRISPSGFCNQYEDGYTWYKQNILREDVFQGNTSTCYGSCIHARIGAYWSGIKIDTDTEVDYISTFSDKPEVNDWDVMELLDRTWEPIAEFVSSMPKPTEIENSISFQIPNSIYTLSGTFDYLDTNRKVLGDIKTISQTPKQIKTNHKIQIYLYHLIRMMNGLEPMEHIEVLYIVKTKTPKVFTLQEPIDNEFMEWVKSEVKKLIRKLDICSNDKDMIELLFPTNPMSRY